MIIKNEDVAYIAGLVDGEGTFSIVRKHHYGKIKNNYKTSEWRYRGYFSVSFSDLQVMSWLCNWFNSISIKCSFYVEDRGKGYKPIGRLQMQGVERVYKVIQILKPYLKIKLKNALIVEKFCLLRMKVKKNKLGSLSRKYTSYETGLINLLEHTRGFKVLNEERIKIGRDC